MVQAQLNQSNFQQSTPVPSSEVTSNIRDKELRQKKDM